MVDEKSLEGQRPFWVAQPIDMAKQNGKKNLAIEAALASFFIIGLGQIYLGHKKRGIVLFFIPFIIFFFSMIIAVITGLWGIEVFILLGIPIVWGLSIFDAWQLAKSRPGPFDFLERNRDK